MLGRTFEALKEFQIDWSPFPQGSLSGYQGLQVDLPTCTTLELDNCSLDYLRFLSCSNVQILRWSQSPAWTTFDLAALNSFHDFLFNFSYLQQLYISIPLYSGLDSLIRLVCRDAWRDIRSVEVKVWFRDSLGNDEYHSFTEMVGHPKIYEKWWKEFTVTEEDPSPMAIVRASM